MNLIKASCGDFEKLTLFYSCAIKNTENMEIYAKWVYGKHPTDEMIMRYISEGALYFCERNGSVISAAAVTPYQGEDYHNTSWSIRIADDEAAVVHILCVEPKLQKQGIARETMELIIGLSRKLEKKAVRLDALSSNLPAHRLYESLGFIKMGQERWHTDNVGLADFFLYELVL